MRHLVPIIICLAAASCILFGCNSDFIATESEFQLPYGTYTYTYEDGSVSTIRIDAESLSIQNGDYQYCGQLSALEKLPKARQESAAQGLVLSDEDQAKIVDDCMAIDFSVYDGQILCYVIEDIENHMQNIVGVSEDGSRISGLQMTYYEDDGTIGFGDGFYRLEQ